MRVQGVFGKLFNAGTDFERDGSQFDKLFDDGETFKIGQLEGIALHVPGHTPADMAFIIGDAAFVGDTIRSEEHTSELQSLMRNSYAVFCLKKKTYNI